MITHVTLGELLARRSANPALILLEALGEKYFRDGHLPGARHLPPDRVKELAPVLLTDRDAEIVVYCASETCNNSHVAARELESLGFRNVAVFPGGKKAWSEAGQPIERTGPAAAA